MTTGTNGHADPDASVLKRRLREARLEYAALAAETRLRRLKESVGPALGSDFVRPWQVRLDEFRSDPSFYPLPSRHDRRRGGHFPYYTTEIDLDFLRESSRLLYETNTHARGLLQGWVSFVAGTGFKLKVQPKPEAGPDGKAAAARVTKFFDDWASENHWDERVQHLVLRTERDGDGVLRGFADDGMLKVRFVWPELIVAPPAPPRRDLTGDGAGAAPGEETERWAFGVYNDPDDDETPLRYHLADPWHPGKEGEYLGPSEVEWFSPQKDAGVKRGLPCFTADTRDTLDAAGRLERNLGEGSAVRQAIAYMRKHAAAAEADIEAANLAGADYREPLPFRPDNLRPVQINTPGTVVDFPEGTEPTAIPTNPGTAADSAVVDVLIRSACARFGAPEWLGSANAANMGAYTSSLVAESPFVKRVVRDQAYYRARLLRVVRRALSVAAAAGLVSPADAAAVELDLVPPSPEVRNKLEEAQRAQIEIGLGVDSRQRYCEGQDRDFERVEKDNKEYEAANQPPPGMGPPGMPGGPGGEPPPGAPPGRQGAPAAPAAGAGLSPELVSALSEQSRRLEQIDARVAAIRPPAEPVDPTPLVREHVDAARAETAAQFRALLDRIAAAPDPAAVAREVAEQVVAPVAARLDALPPPPTAEQITASVLAALPPPVDVRGLIEAVLREQTPPPDPDPDPEPGTLLLAEAAAGGRSEGDVWQGQSGRWFTIKGGRAVPAKGPGGAAKTPRPADEAAPAGPGPAGATPPRPAAAEAPKAKAAPKEKPAKPDPVATAKEVMGHLADPGGLTPEKVAAVTEKLKTLTVAQVTAIQKERGSKGGATKQDRIDRLVAAAKAKAPAEPATDDADDFELNPGWRLGRGGDAAPAAAPPAPAPAAKAAAKKPPAAKAAEKPAAAAGRVAAPARAPGPYAGGPVDVPGAMPERDYEELLAASADAPGESYDRGKYVDPSAANRAVVARVTLADLRAGEEVPAAQVSQALRGLMTKAGSRQPFPDDASRNAFNADAVELMSHLPDEALRAQAEEAGLSRRSNTYDPAGGHGPAALYLFRRLGAKPAPGGRPAT